MVERDQWGGVSTGVATQDAAGHPEWYLKNTSGDRFTFRHYDWMWAADIGDAGFQQKWADNVLGRGQRQGLGRRLHGRRQPEHRVPLRRRPGRQVPDRRRLPGRDRLGAGRDRRALPRRRASSWSRTSASGRTTRTVIKRWLRHVDGGMNEMFVKVGQRPRDGYDSAAMWETAAAVDQGRAGGRQGVPRHLALAQRRPRGRPLRLRDDAAGRRRRRPLRDARRLRQRELVPGVRLRDRERRRPPSRARRAASTGAASATASCSSTRPAHPVRVDFGGTYTGSGPDRRDGHDDGAAERARTDHGRPEGGRSDPGRRRRKTQAAQRPRQPGPASEPADRKSSVNRSPAAPAGGCRGTVKLKRGRTVRGARRE